MFFLMGLSTLQPRKDFEGLIEAFGRLLELETDSDLTAELELVVVGGEGWMFESIREKVASRGLSERVHFLGRVTDADLPAIYTLAEAFVFPSCSIGASPPGKPGVINSW